MFKPKISPPPSTVVSAQAQPIPIKYQTSSSLHSSYLLSLSPDRMDEAAFSDLVGSPPSDKPKIRSRE